MEVSQELQKAKDVLNTEREAAYRNALNGEIMIPVSEGKTVTVAGGLENLWSLQTAYEAMFIDPAPEDVRDDATVKQADSSLIYCTEPEWAAMLKYMRGYGKYLFVRNEAIIATIEALTVDKTLTEVWNTTWANIDIPTGL